MPQLYTGDAQPSGLAVFERPECAKLIGAISGLWSFAEAVLAVYFARILVDEGSSLASLTGAVDAFNGIQAFYSKRKMIVAVAQARMLPHSTLAKLRKALESMQSSGDERNEYVHGRYGVDNRYKDELVRFTKTFAAGRGEERVSEADLHGVLERLIQALGNLDALFNVEIKPHLKPVENATVQRILSAVLEQQKDRG